MPLQHAVLALLARGPSHGYELKGSFEQAVGQQWGGLNIGHLYQVLDRLGRDGLIDSERHPQKIKPDRVVHRITPAGRQELERWLAEPAARTRGYRDDFFLKVMAAVQLGDQTAVAGVLRRQRTGLLQELRGLAEAGPVAAADPVVSLLVTAATLHARADLEFVQVAEDALSAQVLDQLRVAAPASSSSSDDGLAASS
jgi:DNA-binding PadR family transcriptional regulator